MTSSPTKISGDCWLLLPMKDDQWLQEEWRSVCWQTFHYSCVHHHVPCLRLLCELLKIQMTYEVYFLWMQDLVSAVVSQKVGPRCVWSAYRAVVFRRTLLQHPSSKTLALICLPCSRKILHNIWLHSFLCLWISLSLQGYCLKCVIYLVWTN